MTRHHWMTLLRVVCGGALLWWALTRVEITHLSELPLWDLDLGWTVLAMILGGVSVLGWAFRWKTFLHICGITLTNREAIRLTMFADFFNLYFLGPLGADGIRALFVNRQHPGKKIAIAGSILLDHVSGLLAGALLYAMFTRPQADWLTTGSTMVPAAALLCTDIFLGVLGFATFMGIAVILHKTTWDLMNRTPFMRLVINPLRPFLYLREHKSSLIKGQLVSIASLICGYAAYWAAGHAVGQTIPTGRIFAILPMVDAVAALPITVSGLGVRENLFVELLGHNLADGAQGALSVSLLGFAAIGVWGLIGGVWLAAHRLRNPFQSSSTTLETGK